MKLSTLETVFRSLNEAGVRYLVAGGVAVNIHGYQRVTVDLDLVIQLDGDNMRAGDAIIAATAIENNLALTTSNVKHFKSIKELQLKAFKP